MSVLLFGSLLGLRPLATVACLRAGAPGGLFTPTLGGLGDSSAQLLAREEPLPPEMVAVNDSFGESATPDQLMEKYKLNEAAIVAAVEAVLKRKK